MDTDSCLSLCLLQKGTPQGGSLRSTQGDVELGDTFESLCPTRLELVTLGILFMPSNISPWFQLGLHHLEPDYYTLYS